jgi:hypothetical protein
MLDVLLDSIQEVMQEHHKALLFSQFASLLVIARERLNGPTNIWTARPPIVRHGWSASRTIPTAVYF